MPKGPNGQKRPADGVGMSVMVARIATGEEEDTSYTSKNRRKSGVAGAEARNKNLTAEKRSKIATKAAEARWKGMESVMTQSISIASRDLFSNGGRRTRDIKYFFRPESTAEQLADYRNRVISQIENDLTSEDAELDSSLLD